MPSLLSTFTPPSSYNISFRYRLQSCSLRLMKHDHATISCFLEYRQMLTTSDFSRCECRHCRSICLRWFHILRFYARLLFGRDGHFQTGRAAKRWQIFSWLLPQRAQLAVGQSHDITSPYWYFYFGDYAYTRRFELFKIDFRFVVNTAQLHAYFPSPLKVDITLIWFDIFTAARWALFFCDS